MYNFLGIDDITQSIAENSAGLDENLYEEIQGGMTYSCVKFRSAAVKQWDKFALTFSDKSRTRRSIPALINWKRPISCERQFGDNLATT